jgi:hypothetical protein
MFRATIGCGDIDASESCEPGVPFYRSGRLPNT